MAAWRWRRKQGIESWQDGRPGQTSPSALGTSHYHPPRSSSSGDLDECRLTMRYATEHPAGLLFARARGEWCSRSCPPAPALVCRALPLCG